MATAAASDAKVFITVEALNGNSCSAMQLKWFLSQYNPPNDNACSAMQLKWFLSRGLLMATAAQCSVSCNSFYPLEARGPVWQYCS